jgi:hypothetical protein
VGSAFKFLCIVENLLGRGNAIQLATEYDAKIVIIFLMVCFEWLNLIAVNASIVAVIINVVGEEFEENMFDVGASIEESSRALVTIKLSLFKRLFVLPFIYGDPLAWWCIHEGQFPNMGFLAKQILGIPSSQVEIERVFNLVGVLTTLRCCHL